MKTSRREFLSVAVGSSAVVSLAALPPRFLLEAAAHESVSREDEHILVVVQLSGGNDGLNTVVPFQDEDYYKNRPSLAVGKSDVLKINDNCGFHPAMQGFADLLESGNLSIIQGVGYPDPNRSHFESMDIWHTCHRNKDARSDGWLGRYFDALASKETTDVPAIHLGENKQPLALAARNTRVPSIRSLDRFRLQNVDDEFQARVTEFSESNRNTENDLLGFVQTSTTSALAASQRVDAASSGYTPSTTYPETQLAEKLKVVAQLIDAGLRARVYYVELDGFDTHSQQADAHTALLRQLSEATAAFVKDINAHSHGDRVLLMTFSEFGRRVKENASEGTDHGAAAPMFLAGNPVAAGLSGESPNLQELQDGDLKHQIDFRQVYATVIEDWLGWNSASVLGGEYGKLRLVS